MGDAGGTDRPPAEDGEARAQIRSFLIADIRGYTLFTQTHGDEAAAKLAARFASLARDVIERRDGHVVELRGDEAICVFVSARQAIRAAIELQERLYEETVADPELPLPAGIGLDAGEAVPVEDGYRGGPSTLLHGCAGKRRRARSSPRERSRTWRGGSKGCGTTNRATSA